MEGGGGGGVAVAWYSGCNKTVQAVAGEHKAAANCGVQAMVWIIVAWLLQQVRRRACAPCPFPHTPQLRSLKKTCFRLATGQPELVRICSRARGRHGDDLLAEVAAAVFPSPLPLHLIQPPFSFLSASPHQSNSRLSARSSGSYCLRRPARWHLPPAMPRALQKKSLAAKRLCCWPRSWTPTASRRLPWPRSRSALFPAHSCAPCAPASLRFSCSP